MMNDNDAFWYSLMPTMCVAADGTLTGINAACRVLFGAPVLGCGGRHVRFLESALAEALSGTLFPAEGMIQRVAIPSSDSSGGGHPAAFATDDLRVRVSECSFGSERFGDVRLRVSEVPRVHATAGTYAGSFVSIEPLAMDAIKTFHEATQRHIGHELMWEVYAASYDRILPELAFYREVVERHLAALKPKEIETVLDIGAGTGSVTLPLLRIGKQVTAVDSSRGMLRRLVAKVDDPWANRLNTVADSAERLPLFADSTFDGVNVLLALFDMQDAASALNEAIRVLRPRGVLIATEPRQCFNVTELMAAAEEMLRASGRFECLRADWNRIHSIAPRIRDAIATSQSGTRGVHAEQIAEELCQRGFTQVSIRPSHLGNCATIAGRKPSAHSAHKSCVLQSGEMTN